MAVGALLLQFPTTRHFARSRDSSAISATQSGIRGYAFREHPPSALLIRSSSTAAASTVRAATSVAGGAGEGGGGEAVLGAADEIKAALYRALQGINRGIFGVQSAKKSEIESLVELLESQNPTPEPTDHLDQVDGCWKLVYSTITILGSKRTKLGLRDFVTLGDFFQTIDVTQGKAVNEIKFSVRGLKMLSGQLTIVASFKIASKTRVDIKFEDSDIAPEQLMNLFQKNYDLLLAIFNPDGWLEITYVDRSTRIGRDDKGNIFILKRTGEGKA